MADCKIVNQNVVTAVGEIEDIAKKFQTDGDNFITALNNAISEMEGETKDSLKTFFDNDVNKFVAEQIYSAIHGMSDLLSSNRENFEKIDKQIADSISGNK